MKNILVIAILILAFPMLVMADPPTTRPALSNPIMRRSGPRGRNPGRDNQPSSRPSVTFTPLEWDEALSFMQQYSPKRAAALNDAMKNSDLSEGLKKVLQTQVIKKWRNYKLLEEKFPAMAELALERIGIEDSLYDLGVKIQADPSQSKEVSQQIHDEATKLVDKRIEEQNARIENLNKLLAAEQATLTEMNLHRQNQIEKIMGRSHAATTSTDGDHGEVSHAFDDITANADNLPPGDVANP